MSDRLIIRFSGGGLGIAGAAINFATWSKFSHVETEFPGNSPDSKLFGAMPFVGVSYRPIPDKPEPLVRRFIVKGGEAFEDAVEEALVSQFKSPYDYAGVIGFGLHRDWAEEGSWFCSELVAWAWQEAGYPLLHADHCSRVSPRDLLMSPLLEEI